MKWIHFDSSLREVSYIVKMKGGGPTFWYKFYKWMRGGLSFILAQESFLLLWKWGDRGGLFWGNILILAKGALYCMREWLHFDADRRELSYIVWMRGERGLHFDENQTKGSFLKLCKWWDCYTLMANQKELSCIV